MSDHNIIFGPNHMDRVQKINEGVNKLMSELELQTINWIEKLNKEEIGEENGVKFVYLKGLQRLAKLKGIKSEKFTPGTSFLWVNPKDNRSFPFVQMTYEVTFIDGTTFAGAADAHYYNLDHDGGFDRYPTAFAANRAEARALRKALGINLVAKEELSDTQLPDSTISVAQKAAITKLLKVKKKDVGEITKECCNGRQVFKLDDFTAQEAQAAMRFLNSIKD